MNLNSFPFRSCFQSRMQRGTAKLNSFLHFSAFYSVLLQISARREYRGTVLPEEGLFQAPERRLLYIGTLKS